MMGASVSRWAVRVVMFVLAGWAWHRHGWDVGLVLTLLVARAEMADIGIMHIGVGHHRIVAAIDAARKGAQYADAARRLGKS